MVSTNAPPAPPQSGLEPKVAGLRVRPLLPVALYLLLLASGGMALWAQRVQPPGWLAVAAPWVFLSFAVGFSVYRLALVLAGRYPASKAFLQIVIAALFFALLLVPRLQGGDPPRGALVGSLGHPDAEVRALAAELAGYRGDVEAAPRLVELLEDRSAEVRRAAHGALVRLNGADLGAPDDSTAREAWRSRFPTRVP